ncbi:MAG: hypothetical protein FJ167_08950 [Gammaproteobacteria bacterium]|nr:hypothetical protein [Gammaproteobacteria bacterium]
MQAHVDYLEMFFDWFAKQRLWVGAVPMNGAVNFIEGVTSVLWYRSGPFQVQLFVVPPNYIIPEHTHPNVDSFEVYVGGQIKFSHNGQFVTNWDNHHENGACSPFRGQIIRVRPHDKHGGVFGPSGGVFMSVQHWLNGVAPHCVAADYTGVAMGPNHASQVVYGDVTVKSVLAENDAVSSV